MVKFTSTAAALALIASFAVAAPVAQVYKRNAQSAPWPESHVGAVIDKRDAQWTTNPGSHVGPIIDSRDAQWNTNPGSHGPVVSKRDAQGIHGDFESGWRERNAQGYRADFTPGWQGKRDA
ncbi:Hypothetical protein D9617_31g063960 [Elsinoe fawcettii]|nr:Hypothetical protein D9617_31g063960 [Elsinoe fawcettii]